MFTGKNSSRGTISFVRRHPVLLVLGLVFFSVTVLVLIALYISPPSEPEPVRQTRRPSNRPDVAKPETMPVIAGGAIVEQSRFSRIMFNALLITTAAILAVLLVQGIRVLQAL